jgi:hypothetical protein
MKEGERYLVVELMTTRVISRERERESAATNMGRDGDGDGDGLKK